MTEPWRYMLGLPAYETKAETIEQIRSVARSRFGAESHVASDQADARRGHAACDKVGYLDAPGGTWVVCRPRPLT